MKQADKSSKPFRAADAATKSAQATALPTAQGESPARPSFISSRAGIKRWQKSKLEQLTPKQLAEVLLWFSRENIVYHEAKRRLREKFGLELSISTISDFWRDHFTAESPDLSLLDVNIDVRGTPIRIHITTPRTVADAKGK